jgi:hypothetical protein
MVQNPEKDALVDAVATTITAASAACEALREYERTHPETGPALAFKSLTSDKVANWLARVAAVRAGELTV